MSGSTSGGEQPVLTYLHLRRAIGVVGFLLPTVLLCGGLVDGRLRGSISAYYYGRFGDYFTGSLCVIGVFLLFYGYADWPVSGRWEPWRQLVRAVRRLIPRIAGVAALGVAFFHTAPGAGATATERHLGVVHTCCAAALFALLGAISFFYFPEGGIRAGHRARYPIAYRALGVVMWVSMILIGVFKALVAGAFDRAHGLFWLESVMVYAFSASWLIKGQFVRGVTRAARRRLPPGRVPAAVRALDRPHV